MDNLVIPRAATKVACQPGSNPIFRGVWFSVKQCFGGDQDTRRAITALKGSLIDKSLLERVQSPPIRQTFDSNHFLPIYLHA
jgi:hypothetical protein